MDVAQDLIYITSHNIYCKPLNILFFTLMMHIESSTLLKNHGSSNFLLKYYITISL